MYITEKDGTKRRITYGEQLGCTCGGCSCLLLALLFLAAFLGLFL